MSRSVTHVLPISVLLTKDMQYQHCGSLPIVQVRIARLEDSRLTDFDFVACLAMDLCTLSIRIFTAVSQHVVYTACR